jgi:hypothetical protein
MFDPDRGEVLKRFWAFYPWWDKNQESIAKKFDITPHFKPIMPFCTLPLTGNVTIVYPEGMQAAVPKGLTIRLELMAILDTLTPADREHTYFVQIDGSGAINYHGIELVLEKLLQDTTSPQIVLGKRPNESPDWCMGHPERKAIEVFEKFLIEERFRMTIDEEFGGALPDAQAGRWGLRMDVLSKLSLTAGGYDLELDVITSALELLESGLLEKNKVAFTRDLSCDERIGGGGGAGSATFQLKKTNTINKFPFLLHKLGYNKGELWRVLEKFDKNTLPQEYVAAVHEWITN